MVTPSKNPSTNENEVDENTGPPTENKSDESDAMDTKYGARSGEHNLRTRLTHARHSRRHRNSTALHEAGTQTVRRKGVDSVLVELKQLHDRKVVEPKKVLTRAE